MIEYSIVSGRFYRDGVRLDPKPDHQGYLTICRGKQRTKAHRRVRR